MAVVMEQQQNFKHYCRICKKGFGCGRALGGHMRAHGFEDETGHIDDDDPISDWEDKQSGGGQGGNKRMYALRTNPNRLKSCRMCKNCGKEFVSWKSFLEHGKCSSDDAEESLVSSPVSDGDEDGVGGQKGCCGWSKGKRSRRVVKLGNLNVNCPSSEEEDLANCLVMLSAARVDPVVVETEESCASASKEEERQQRNWPGIDADIGRSLAEKVKGPPKGMFECKACKKVFSSHQALGGHRASHKKVKGCFAAKLDELDESLIEEDVITHEEFSIPAKNATTPLDHVERIGSMVPSKRKSKLHECSICHRIFTSGQALGGHKRCHWVTSNTPDTSIARFRQIQDHIQHLQQRPLFKKSQPLDLNLPAPVDDIGGARLETENPISFELPVALYLQQWIGVQTNNNDDNNNNNNNSSSVIQVDDEVDSRVKLAKLSDLKDMNMGGGSSPWLQVGIGSTANESGGP